MKFLNMSIFISPNILKIIRKGNWRKRNKTRLYWAGPLDSACRNQHEIYHNGRWLGITLDVAQNLKKKKMNCAHQLYTWICRDVNGTHGIFAQFTIMLLWLDHTDCCSASDACTNSQEKMMRKCVMYVVHALYCFRIRCIWEILLCQMILTFCHILVEPLALSERKRKCGLLIWKEIWHD
jgi:hypothetical protein